ncbi:MAG: tetratricopeptide repeat protein, partial [Proteobacteria bacterium]|nr:tetratricopeptide repeat protein [Pseudomonadota bacterium]
MRPRTALALAVGATLLAPAAGVAPPIITPVLAQTDTLQVELRAAEGDLDQRKFGDAYERARAVATKALQRSGERDAMLAPAWLVMAKAAAALGQAAQAEKDYRQAIASGEKIHGADHPAIVAPLVGFAGLYSGIGRYAQAEPLYRRALAIEEKTLGAGHVAVAKTYALIGDMYVRAARFAPADAAYGRALAIREKALGPVHPDVAAILDRLGLNAIRLGRRADAVQLLQRAVAIEEKVNGIGAGPLDDLAAA